MADHHHQLPSFLTSPRFFNGFLSKNQSETDSFSSSLSSPTSVLDTKNPSILLNPFACDTKNLQKPKPIGLALIDSITDDEKPDDLSFSKPLINRMALFGSKLKIQIPSVTAKMMSLQEMELFEDYTCVITHGPNPRTTHIFDNCIVQSCNGHKNMEFGVEEAVDFLSFCHTCKVTLGPGMDIYMYRGDKAFCSQECRDQEMLLEELKNPKMDDDGAF